MTTANFGTPIQWVAPLVIACVFVSLCSLIKEPSRQKFMAIFVAGAGAAYLSGRGGFGLWEIAFCASVTICAFNGLRSYRLIGVAWLLHSAWDILHHLNGNPLLPFSSTSSLGCAICDPVIAAWCFAGAPSVFDDIRGVRLRRAPRTV